MLAVSKHGNSYSFSEGEPLPYQLKGYHGGIPLRRRPIFVLDPGVAGSEDTPVASRLPGFSDMEPHPRKGCWDQITLVSGEAMRKAWLPKGKAVAVHK